MKKSRTTRTVTASLFVPGSGRILHNVSGASVASEAGRGKTTSCSFAHRSGSLPCRSSGDCCQCLNANPPSCQHVVVRVWRGYFVLYPHVSELRGERDTTRCSVVSGPPEPHLAFHCSLPTLVPSTPAPLVPTSRSNRLEEMNVCKLASVARLGRVKHHAGSAFELATL